MPNRPPLAPPDTVHTARNTARRCAGPTGSVRTVLPGADRGGVRADRQRDPARPYTDHLRRVGRRAGSPAPPPSALLAAGAVAQRARSTPLDSVPMGDRRTQGFPLWRRLAPLPKILTRCGESKGGRLLPSSWLAALRGGQNERESPRLRRDRPEGYASDQTLAQWIQQASMPWPDGRGQRQDLPGVRLNTPTNPGRARPRAEMNY